MNTRHASVTSSAALTAGFREPGYLSRLARMLHGFSQPRASRAHREAMIELQRLSAPVSALLLPVLAVLLLCLLSADRRTSERLFETILLEADPPLQLQETNEPIPTETSSALEVNNTFDIAGSVVRSELPLPVTVPSPALTPTLRADPALRDVVIFKTPGGYGRTAAVRSRHLADNGGSQSTEDAVLRALRWLKKNQQPDGSWTQNKVAMTGLAVLTFLAHDERPGQSEEFGATVQRALEYLMSVQNKTTGRLPGNYDHPIAAYALCEAFALTRNPNVRAAAELALAPLLAGQHPTGGWTYHMDPGVCPETGTYRDDTSYMGWCAQTLKAAKMAGLKVDGLDKACKLAVKGFKRNAAPGGGFGYTGPGAGGLTSVGTLCMQLLGAGDEREVGKSLGLMETWKPSLETKGPMGGSLQYYFYYATQCKFHAGGKAWENWNREMKTIYTAAQQIEKNAVKDPQGRDCDIGWWTNGDAHTDRPVMDTCLASLQLMVYYRYLHTTRVAAVSVEPELRAVATESGDIPVETSLNL